MVTIRSTLSSNSSQPCSRTSTVRCVGILASLALLYSNWLRLSVIPITLTSYFSIARTSAPPQPQPMSSNVMPGSRLSLPSARSNFAFDASSSVMSSRSKYAHV